jgi:phosphatidylglycerophosphate synthase
VLDGTLARRRGTTSEFGAQFDVEVDALFVLALDVELWQRGRLDAWILLSGILRYGYVLALSSFPNGREPAPSSRFGRIAYSLLVIGLLGALLDDGDLGTASAAFGTLLVSVSFLRSFHHSFFTAGVPPRGG